MDLYTLPEKVHLFEEDGFFWNSLQICRNLYP